MSEKLQSGIYIIECSKDPRLYIGQSKNVEARLASHLKGLRDGGGHCSKLNEAWRLHGEEAFTFRLLFRVPVEHLDDAEQLLIQAYYKNGVLFNTSTARYPVRGPRKPKREPVVVVGPFLRAKQAAAYCGMPEPDFQALRAKKQGPRAFKVGRCVIYATGHLDRWVEERQEAA